MVEVYKKGNKVILAGKVKEIVDGVSQKGKEYVRVVLSQTRYDADMELEVEDEATVIFTNREDGPYGAEMNADRIKKLKIKAGTTIALKATRKENEDGTVAYYGLRAQYPGCRFEFKATEDGPAAEVVVGIAIVKAENNISVPISVFDAKGTTKEEKNKTAWLTTKAQENTDVAEGTFDPTSEKKRPVVAFVIPKITKTKTDTGISWSGDFIACERVS